MTTHVPIRDLMSNAVPDLADKARELRIMEQLSVDDPTLCYECGKCTSGCPAFLLKELMPHRIMGLVNLGFIDELVNGDVIWACTICLRCKDRCPQAVSPVDAIWALRNLATAKGIQNPNGFNIMLGALLEKGIYQDAQENLCRNVETGKKSFKTRQTVGLEGVSTPTDKDKFQMALIAIMQEEI